MLPTWETRTTVLQWWFICMPLCSCVRLEFHKCGCMPNVKTQEEHLCRRWEWETLLTVYHWKASQSGDLPGSLCSCVCSLGFVPRRAVLSATSLVSRVKLLPQASISVPSSGLRFLFLFWYKTEGLDWRFPSFSLYNLILKILKKKKNIGLSSFWERTDSRIICCH